MRNLFANSIDLIIYLLENERPKLLMYQNDLII